MVKVDGNRFRQKRMEHFLALADRVAVKDRPLRVLDIGGTKSYWQALEPIWKGYDFDLTIVNLNAPTLDEGRYHMRTGNACAMHEYDDKSFDIVHSNSVIEHVGQWSKMTEMANEVRRLAPHYFVQTPNIWFPVEPHFRSLFFALRPEVTRAHMLMRKRRGFRGPYDHFSEAIGVIQSVNLLDATGLQELFPEGHLIRERVLGFTKSLIMIR